MESIAMLCILGAVVAASVSWGVNPTLMRIARPAMYGLGAVGAALGLISWGLR